MIMWPARRLSTAPAGRIPLRTGRRGDAIAVDLPLSEDGTIDTLRGLKDETVSLAAMLALDSRPAVEAWQRVIEARLLPRLDPDFPLVAAICGGGSSGKSTLFNTLAGEGVSPTGGRAGINRRILMALGDAYRLTPRVADALFDPLACRPQPLTEAGQATVSGDPLLYYASRLPTGVALMDTPDFDTGARGGYQNREMAERALRAADVLVYIFTNAGYNNRDNTDFISRMLTAVGTRGAFLVYRADPGFSDREIRDHAATVARNLYGEAAGEHVLGIYRADEDNRVARGDAPMALRSVDAEKPDLRTALITLDPRRVRGDLHRSIFNDVLDQGRQFLAEARESAAHLALYLDALAAVQQQCVREALGHLPMDQVMHRFADIWQATDPRHIKVMRQTGRVVETPLRLMLGVARWVRGKRGSGAGRSTNETHAALAADLSRAAGRLRKAAVDPILALRLPETEPVAAALRDAARRLGGRAGVAVRRSDAGMLDFAIPAHPALATGRADLEREVWTAAIDEMLARQDSLLGLTDRLENELQRLVGEQRARMTTADQIRQTLSAMLNIIPATAAVTYVLHTGDPVGAVGIKVKLVGLFGLNDLYALVAIPATAGMKRADLKQLEAILGPVARAWLTEKLAAIDTLFETRITGALRDAGQRIGRRAADTIAAADSHLKHLETIVEALP